MKTHRYRGTMYTIAVQPALPERLVAIPKDLPPVVLFELARDLAAANGLDL